MSETAARPPSTRARTSAGSTASASRSGASRSVIDEDAGTPAAGPRARRRARRPRAQRDAAATTRPGGDRGAVRDGWLHTGDLGYATRTASSSSSTAKGPGHPGGYNVYPREVEDVLYEHPASPRPRSWACRTTARRGGHGLRGRSGRATTTAGRADRVTARSGSLPTSTRRRSSSCTTCRRTPPARSSSATSGATNDQDPQIS